METLLTKVQDIETEASNLVETAKKAGSAAVATLRAREEEMVADMREKAHAKAQTIIQEKVQAAEKEINTIKQQGENAAKVVHSAAEKNRADAITLAKRFFTEEYLG